MGNIVINWLKYEIFYIIEIHTQNKIQGKRDNLFDHHGSYVI